VNRQFPTLRQNYRTNWGLIYMTNPQHTDWLRKSYVYQYSNLHTATTSLLVQEGDRPHGRSLYSTLTSRTVYYRIYEKQLPDILNIHLIEVSLTFDICFRFLRHSIVTIYMCTMHLSKMDQHAACKTTHQTNKKFIMRTDGHRLAISNNVKSRNVTVTIGKTTSKA